MDEVFRKGSVFLQRPTCKVLILNVLTLTFNLFLLAENPALRDTHFRRHHLLQTVDIQEYWSKLLKWESSFDLSDVAISRQTVDVDVNTK